MYEIETTHWWFRSLHELVIRSFANHHKGSPSILDAGCGTGRLMVQMQNLGEITGFDFRETALSYCKKRKLNNIRKTDLNIWKPIENEFDFIVSLDVVSDKGIKDDKQLLKKFHRSLKPGGKLILHLPAFPILKRSHDNAATIRKRYLKDGIVELAKEIGFSNIQAQYRLSFAFPLFFLSRLYESMFRNHEKEKSDLFALPSFVNNFLLGLSRLENSLICRGWSFPWGTSLFSILQKS